MSTRHDTPPASAAQAVTNLADVDFREAQFFFTSRLRGESAGGGGWCRIAPSIREARVGDPAVSVLLPTFNRAAYLDASVQSVLAQTLRDLELVVIDDGSTDDTAALLARVGDPRLRVVRQPNAGCASALNAGLAVARGRYVARNDSDDVWYPDLLAALVPRLEADPALGFVYARCDGMHADGRPSSATRGGPLRDPSDALASLLYADYTASIATVYRRSCIDRVGRFDAALDTSEDWDLAVRVARRFPVAFVDRTVATIRAHHGNATALRAPGLAGRMARRRRVLDKIFADPDLPTGASRMRPLAYRNFHISSALLWLSIGAYRVAGRSLASAIRAGGCVPLTVGRALWTAVNWFGVSRSRAATRVLRRGVAWSRRAS